MTVIGYVVPCQTCGTRMVVTLDGRDEKYCPRCLAIYLDIDHQMPATDEDTDHIPPWQVHG